MKRILPLTVFSIALAASPALQAFWVTPIEPLATPRDFVAGDFPELFLKTSLPKTLFNQEPPSAKQDVLFSANPPVIITLFPVRGSADDNDPPQPPKNDPNTKEDKDSSQSPQAQQVPPPPSSQSEVGNETAGSPPPRPALTERQALEALQDTTARIAQFVLEQPTHNTIQDAFQALAASPLWRPHFTALGLNPGWFGVRRGHNDEATSPLYLYPEAMCGMLFLSGNLETFNLESRPIEGLDNTHLITERRGYGTGYTRHLPNGNPWLAHQNSRIIHTAPNRIENALHQAQTALTQAGALLAMAPTGPGQLTEDIADTVATFHYFTLIAHPFFAGSDQIAEAIVQGALQRLGLQAHFPDYNTTIEALLGVVIPPTDLHSFQSPAIRGQFARIFQNPDVVRHRVTLSPLQHVTPVAHAAITLEIFKRWYRAAVRLYMAPDASLDVD